MKLENLHFITIIEILDSDQEMSVDVNIKG